MNANSLHVVAAYFNPIMFNTRKDLCTHFIQHMIQSGVKLTLVECQLGERAFEFNTTPGINWVGVRSKTLVWNKENLLKIGINNIVQNYDPSAKYFCWADADIHFRDPNWATKTIHALQQYDIIQPWSDAYDLGPHGVHLQTHKSFCRLYKEDKPVVAGGANFWKFDGGLYDYAHSGYVWAITRLAYEWVGGLMEFAAAGAADHHQALSLVGAADKSMPGGVNPVYAARVFEWQRKALAHINYNIGFIYGTIEHEWHGRKTDRKYIERWDILVEQDFNPDTDIKYNSFGVIELAGNKPRLKHLLDMYFRNRNDDANTIS